MDENGTQVGIIGIREALALAEERGFDLVEVAPNAVPPVCRLLDYGKFRYEQSQKEREARRNQKQADLKQIRLMPRTAEHDISTKANQAKKFLLQGDKVKFNVRFRGREMAHPDIGRKMLEDIAEQLRDIAVVEQKPLLEGRVLSLLLAPNPKVLKAAQQAQKERAKLARTQGVAGEQSGSAVPPETDEDLDEQTDLQAEEFDDEADLQDETLDDEEFDADEFDDEDEQDLSPRLKK
ncbi:MAG: translation initiation factor IF-3 [Chloroflexaceae bacterium]